MAYQALYRKYRSQRFDEMVGQEVVATTLKNAIVNGQISHAYLFSGPRGTGKTSAAKIFAKAINCPNQKDGEPCNNCDICQAITQGSLEDVIELDAASNNGVDEIRKYGINPLMQRVEQLIKFISSMKCTCCRQVLLMPC
jgi:DNA polymerase-3 subunit gamma/tau